ncbi:response regulator [Geothrix alkalitolerans]|uniref:response regulator n=1 Tax=Geothrix alkalitolerans TaxID=2922724 RepID=UPI001FB049B8|nr:response regulator [Geothrix alkalitolerans]
MPRLLLVDDNPSIHRIAESLLAPTDVEVVCVDSAAEALDRIARGERFDVALVDTAMPGMDGWALLARMREMEATARLPIAMMAGVLDPVDPAKLAQAPIQGFLKKPIELRELADRVKALLATPVASAAPVAAAPAAALVAAVAPPTQEPAKTAEFARPVFPPDLPPPAVAADFPVPDISLPTLDAGPEPPQIALVDTAEDDLLVLTAEDLWPEDVAVGAAPVPAPEPIHAPVPEPMAVPISALASEPPAVAQVHLDLEELDLDSLHGLATESLPSLPAAIPAAAESLPVPPSLPPVAASVPEPAPEPVSEPAPAEALVEESLPAFSGLEALDDLGGTLELPPLPEPPAAAERPSVLPAAGVAFAGLAAGAAGLLGRSQEAHQPAPETPHPSPHPAAPEPQAVPFLEPPLPAPPVAGIPPVVPFAPPAAPVMPVLAAPVEATTAAPGQAPAAPGQAALTPAQVQALLADPALMDALVKALVARMGDQVIREIAWEVMPELAGRLQR